VVLFNKECVQVDANNERQWDAAKVKVITPSLLSL
jgi:hypothetical protein